MIDDDQDHTIRLVDVMTPGELRLELAEQSASGQDFVRFKAEYRTLSLWRLRDRHAAPAAAL